MPMPLAGRIIIVTGASSGIGAATAVACAREGMDLVITARRADRLDTVAKRIESMERRVATVVGDVAEPDMARRLVRTAQQAFGGFDFVFANAGFGASRFSLEETMEETRRMFDVNFFAAVDLLRVSARSLIDAGRPGHLLMCASCQSRFTLPLSGTYSATKAAQSAICAALRHELREHRIEVSSVHPVTTETEFFENASRNGGLPEPVDGKPGHAPKLFVQSPERVARAVVRCLSRPVPEVWTSHTVRFFAAMATAFPSLGQWLLARQTREEFAAARAMESRDRGGR